MKRLSANEVRQLWIDFFLSKDHHFLEPVSLIPVNDPSLLWINSGVATLKPYFDGRLTPPSKRLVNCQKALRTNDIENVGITARHQTMFEMLGNFSIGDYFKKEALEFAWELLTNKEWFGFNPNQLYITVFNEDDEAYDLWTQHLKVAPDHIFQMGRETNFWDVGQGPCGPNTEIFFDRGTTWDQQNLGTKLLSDDLENDRYIEIWNIVFSQFNNDGNGNYSELPRKNIDTGAGLERLVSIFQETPTNFETDLFFPIIQQVEKLSGKYHYSVENYFNPDPEQTKINTAFKVIADHIRAVTFAIGDGAFPSNKDRGYVLRRLIRRGSVYGRKLGINQAFMYQLVPTVVEIMDSFYPSLKTHRDLIVKTVKTEEEKFLKTLTNGFEMLTDLIDNQKKVSPEDALLLFESFGFPVELTQELVLEQELSFDLAGYEKLLETLKTQSRNARQDLKAWNNQNALFTKLEVPSEFIGWETLVNDQAKVVYLFVDEQEVQQASEGTVYVILDKTPFYAEKGGQAADYGTLTLSDGSVVEVSDVQQGPKGQNIHQVKLSGTELKLGDVVQAKVDEQKRLLTMKNHSGTHLIHAALREVLGNTVMQSGSYNDEFGLRMDFSYDANISPEQLEAAEKLVNQKIQEAIPREVYFTTLDEAINKYHALAFFTEKYNQTVRVVKFGEFSCELCGGTHVANTSEIEDFIITGLESKGAGVYRIKALTSKATVHHYLEKEIASLKEEATNVQTKYDLHKEILQDKDLETLFGKIQTLTISKENLVLLKDLVKEVKENFKHWQHQVDERLTQQKVTQFVDVQPVKNSNGFNEIKLEVQGLTINDLKTLADVLRNKYPDLIVILTSTVGENHFVVVGVSESLQTKVSAIDIFKQLPQKPKGGGNENLAQGKY